MRSFAACCCALFLMGAIHLHAEDWPQWRGSTRNGVVPGPALVESVPKEGVPEVWKLQGIPSDGAGGFASFAIVGGKAYLYVSWKYKEPIPTRTLDQKGLDGLGVSRTPLPKELSEKVEATRISEERKKQDRKTLRTWVAEWNKKNLDADQQKKFGRYVSRRLQDGEKAIALEVLGKLASIKGKEFAGSAEFDAWCTENGISGELKKRVDRVIPTFNELCKDVMLCLDAKDGKELWKKEFPGKKSTWGASGSPCVVDGKMYSVSTTGHVYCLDAQTGEEVWKAKVGDKGINSSPLVVDGSVVLFAGALTALDAGTGKVKWQAKKVSSGNASAALWKKDGKSYLICNGSKIACIDPADGKVLWEVPGGGSCTAAVAGDHVLVLGGKLLAYKMGLEKAEKLWEAAVKDRGASPLIHEGHVYALAKGRAVCVKLEDGSVAWDQKVGIGEISSPLMSDGKIFAFGNGGITVIAASPEKYTLLGTQKCAAARCTSPVISDGKVYIRTKSGLACYDFGKK